MGAPAEFGGLQAFRNEAFDRPGVREHVQRLRRLGALRVALGDVDALDAEPSASASPSPRGRLRLFDEVEAEVGGEIDQRLLDEPGHHARIGAAAGDRRGAARDCCALRREQRLAQRIVGARASVALLLSK